MHFDEDFIARCLDNDAKAQAKLYQWFAPKMFGICLRYTRNQMEAEDILQEGFIKVFKYLKTFKNEGSFEGWIRRIMVREAISYLRQKKKIEFVTEDHYIEHDYTNNIKTNIEVAEIQQLIDSLPEGYRMVFVMYAIEGYKHYEIAELLKISEGTSKSQLFKARQMLQKKIKELNSSSYGTN